MEYLIARDLVFVVAAISVSWGVHWLYYHYKLQVAKKLRTEYVTVLETIAEGLEDDPTYDKLFEVDQLSVKLFKESDTYPSAWASSYLSDEQIGSKGPSRSRVKIYERCFHKTIGYFRSRRNQSFNIVYWLEIVTNWPRKLAEMLGFKKDGAFANMLKAAILLLEIVGLVLLVAHRAQSLSS